MFSCKKMSEDKKQDDLYIRGRLFLTDTLTQNNINIPLGNKSVQLAESNGDLLNFLYSDTTDKDGYFVFNLLNSSSEKDFIVRYEEKVSEVWYSGSASAKKGQANIALVAELSQTRQNGFYTFVKDSLNGGMPGAKVYLFNSRVLAEINSPAGAVDSLVANSTGRIFKLNINPGLYYLNAIKKVDTLVFEKRLFEVTIAEKGIILPIAGPIILLRTK